MYFADVQPALIHEGKAFRRDAWFDEVAEARGQDQNYVVWQRGYPQGIPINQNTADATGLPEGTVCTFSPYLMRHWGSNNFGPYQLTQEDMAATDWEPFTRHPVVIGHNFEGPQ